MRIVDTGTIRQVQPGDRERIGVTLLVPQVDQVLRRTIAVGTTVHGKGATTIGTRLSDAGFCRTTMTTRPVQLEVPARTGKTHQDQQAAPANCLIEICVTNYCVARPAADASGARRSASSGSARLVDCTRWRPMT